MGKEGNGVSVNHAETETTWEEERDQRARGNVDRSSGEDSNTTEQSKAGRHTHVKMP